MFNIHQNYPNDFHSDHHSRSILDNLGTSVERDDLCSWYHLSRVQSQHDDGQFRKNYNFMFQNLSHNLRLDNQPINNEILGYPERCHNHCFISIVLG